MSLRGSEATDAISQGFEKNEIAALSRSSGGARNDKEGIAALSLGKAGKG